MMNDFRLLKQALTKGWWIILATLLVAIGGGALISYSTPPLYASTATFVVSSRLRTTDPGDLIRSLDTLAGRSAVVLTYCKVLESQSVLDSAAASINVPSEVALDYDATCSVPPDSSIIELEVTGPSAVLAADLANAMGDVGLKFIDDLQEVYGLRRLDTAEAMPKPISPNHLLDLILATLIGFGGGVGLALFQQTLMEDASRQLLALFGRRAEEIPAKIMVVDDEPSIVKLITTHLTNGGYYVKSANDAKSALEIAGTWRPDLILLDVMLPGLDGFQLANRFRSIDELASIPIIMLSALASIKDKEVGYKSGADDYITKPFDGSELLLKVQAHLRRRASFGGPIPSPQDHKSALSDSSRESNKAKSERVATSGEGMLAGVGLFLSKIVPRADSMVPGRVTTEVRDMPTGDDAQEHPEADDFEGFADDAGQVMTAEHESFEVRDMPTGDDAEEYPEADDSERFADDGGQEMTAQHESAEEAQYSAQEVLNAFYEVLRKRGIPDRLLEYVELAGLGHLINQRNAPYRGEPIMSLPIPDEELKAEILAYLTSRPRFRD